MNETRMATRHTGLMKKRGRAPRRGTIRASHAVAAKGRFPWFCRPIALVMVIVLGASTALAYDVTVVGVPPGPSCCRTPPDAGLPSPGGLLQPNLENLPAGPALGQFDHPDGPLGPDGPNAAGSDLVVCPGKPIEANGYGRIDYFRWIEPRSGADRVTESGALYTMGYTRCIGSERLRGEVFGGAMTYSTAVTDWGIVDPLESSTSYIAPAANTSICGTCTISGRRCFWALAAAFGSAISGTPCRRAASTYHPANKRGGRSIPMWAWKRNGCATTRANFSFPAGSAARS